MQMTDCLPAVDTRVEYTAKTRLSEALLFRDGTGAYQQATEHPGIVRLGIGQTLDVLARNNEDMLGAAGLMSRKA